MLIPCKRCKTRLEAKPHKQWHIVIRDGNLNKNESFRYPIQWMKAYCEDCMETTRISADFVQPEDKYFKMIYERDPFAEEAIEAKKQQEKKWQEKEDLDKKYYNMFRHTHKHVVTSDEKFIRKEVLGGGTMVDEEIAKNKERLVKEGKLDKRGKYRR